MKQGSTLFLKAVVVLMGIAALAVAIFALPAGIQYENTGFYRPILYGLYLPAIPFFIALFQTLKLLSYIDKNKAFSDLSVTALKKIKYCGIAISAIFVAGMPYIYYAAERDDAPGVILIGMAFVFAAATVATFAAVLQKLVQNGLDLKSENDLTV